MTRSALFLVASLLGASCEKAPAEPPTPPSSPAATAGASGASGAVPAAGREARCVRPLSSAPPPAPLASADPRCPRDPAGGSPMVPVGHVRFPQSKDAPVLEVELMLTDAHQERGLMYRKSLADDKGMLFAWGQPSIHTFWMHNTCIPLDMLFIDGDGFIAGIVENAPTLNDEGRTIDCPVNNVLEVPAGWSRRHGVAPGQQVKIEGIPH